MKILSKKTFHLFLSLVAFEFLALYSIKKYKISKENKFVVLAILGYSLVALTLIRIVEKNDSISLTNVTWNILSSMYGIFIGYILFTEEITTKQFLGVAVGMISLLLINGN